MYSKYSSTILNYAPMCMRDRPTLVKRIGVVSVAVDRPKESSSSSLLATIAIPQHHPVPRAQYTCDWAIQEQMHQQPECEVRGATQSRRTSSSREKLGVPRARSPASRVREREKAGRDLLRGQGGRTMRLATGMFAPFQIPSHSLFVCLPHKQGASLLYSVAPPEYAFIAPVSQTCDSAKWLLA